MAEGPRAEIIDSPDPRLVSARIQINAPAALIFDIIRQPRRHREFDGSGSVQRAIRGPERLNLGDRFGMDMKIGVPYRITSTVVEFDADRRIAWCHILGNRWRYELAPLDDTSTMVTESDDLRDVRWFARFSPMARDLEAPKIWIAKSLVALKKLAETEAADSRP